MVVHHPTITRFALVLTCFFQAGALQAHFPWLVRESDGKIAFFFGEGIQDRAYHIPESLLKVQLLSVAADGTKTELEREHVERKDFIGLVSSKEVPQDAVVVADVTYGIYHGAKLTYSTVHWGGSLPASLDEFENRKLQSDLHVVPVATEEGLDVYALWQGKPLTGVSVRLLSSDDDDHDGGSEQETDTQGKASFKNAQLHSGLNAILLGHNYEDAGELDGAKYKSVAHYLTFTFHHDSKAEKATGPKQAQAAGGDNASLAPIPAAITSFGAARIGDSLYVYGGHTGVAHSYSNEEQSNQLLRLNLNDADGAWEEVAVGLKLQGLAMVAHRNQLIVVGGMTALNSEGQPDQLQSQASVRAFDTVTNQWSDLPNLPEPRSSHDAAIIGDTVYVVGGWNLQGNRSGKWHTTALALDLTAESPTWQEVSEPPFARRGLATVAHDGQLFAIGGMNQKGGPTLEVSVYDPKEQQWSETAKLHGEKPMAGFGAAAWSVGGKLVVTTQEGDLQQWDDENHTWTVCGKVADGRFFHRLLPLDDHQLVAVGGANMETGKFVNLEKIEVR